MRMCRQVSPECRWGRRYTYPVAAVVVAVAAAAVVAVPVAVVVVGSKE